VGTFALIHGAGDVGWYWHLVDAELRERLRITPDEIAAEHWVALSRPRELADLLEG
jgi:hypothetical protein